MWRYAIAMLLMATPTMAQDSGLALWGRIHEVFSHPRCANCHVGQDGVPIWSGQSYGPKARPHGMNIAGGESRIGATTVPCSTCHMLSNSQLPHGPPGADGWRLPPVEMQWFGKSSAEICAQIKNSRNPDFDTIAKVAAHIGTPLVKWGWMPGPGREPAPYSAEQLAGFLTDWEKAGAPCPTQ
jgi:hypothetical protein